MGKNKPDRLDKKKKSSKDFAHKGKNSNALKKRDKTLETKKRMKAEFDKSMQKKVKTANASFRKKGSADKKTMDLTLYKGGRTLVVGDGDLTFSVALSSLNVNHTIVATTYDTRDQLLLKYPDSSKTSLDKLLARNIPVFHGVDATKLDASFPMLLKQRLGARKAAKLRSKGIEVEEASTTYRCYPFERIIFNFPHSGEQRVHINRELLKNFFISCRPHLAEARLDEHGRPVDSTAGRVLLVLKKGQPYDNWDVEEQAAHALFELERKCPFDFDAFPGYGHRTTNPEHNEIDDETCYLYVFKLTPVGMIVARREAEKYKSAVQLPSAALANRTKQLAEAKATAELHRDKLHEDKQAALNALKQRLNIVDNVVEIKREGKKKKSKVSLGQNDELNTQDANTGGSSCDVKSLLSGFSVEAALALATTGQK